jgi:hypothetical protein
LGEKAAETAEAVDRHHTYIRKTLRAELDQLQTARQQVDTAVANEQNTLSTLICRMQVISDTNKINELCFRVYLVPWVVRVLRLPTSLL